MKWKLNKESGIWSAIGKRWVYGYKDNALVRKSLAIPPSRIFAVSDYCKNFQTAKSIAKLLEE